MQRGNRKGGQTTRLSTVSLDYGNFTGLTNTTNGIIYFRGIRYADPPLGALSGRLRYPLRQRISGTLMQLLSALLALLLRKMTEERRHLRIACSAMFIFL
ncbi:hypothetical protein B0H10DRAFT_62395 [Mycena sp. CBHHK59/15]|nr:hypothetical protein B0H10DRAFT_62395 [Mycena sp. CBHHK59/15]